MNVHGLNSNNRPPASGGGGGSSQPGCLDQLKNGYLGMPLFNRYLLTFCISLYLVSLVASFLTYYMVMIPSMVLKFQGK